jgi:hypothetical protein
MQTRKNSHALREAHCASRVNIPAPTTPPTTASKAVRTWRVDWCCADEASDGMSIVQVLYIEERKGMSLWQGDTSRYGTYAVA